MEKNMDISQFIDNVVAGNAAAAKEAIPLLDVVASSPDIVIVLFVTAVSIPSPPLIVNVSLIL